MRLCDKCLENNWKYKNIDHWVQATCQCCGHVVEWEPRRPKKVYEGGKCRDCRGTLVKKYPKTHKPNRQFWYAWYLRCDTCLKFFYTDEAKIINDSNNEVRSLRAGSETGGTGQELDSLDSLEMQKHTKETGDNLGLF